MIARVKKHALWRAARLQPHPGRDFLTARDGDQMRRHMADLTDDPDYAREVALRGRETVFARHTCAHRVDELLRVYEEVREEAQ